MTQNLNKSSEGNEIKLPDDVLQKVEEMERKAQKERAESYARKMAEKTPTERAEVESERKKLEELEFAAETKTEAELQREDEKAIEIFDRLKLKNKEV
jgi:hypothetical protein